VVWRTRAVCSVGEGAREESSGVSSRYVGDIDMSITGVALKSVRGTEGYLESQVSIRCANDYSYTETKRPLTHNRKRSGQTILMV
jgi:hypothetical protein